MSEKVSRDFERSQSVNEEVTRSIKQHLVQTHGRILVHVISVDSSGITVDNEFYGCQVSDIGFGVPVPVDTVISGPIPVGAIGDTGSVDVSDITDISDHGVLFIDDSSNNVVIKVDSVSGNTISYTLLIEVTTEIASGATAKGTYFNVTKNRLWKLIDETDARKIAADVMPETTPEEIEAKQVELAAVSELYGSKCAFESHTNR